MHEQEVSVFPNPATNELMIHTTGDELMEINLYDFTSRLLFKEVFTKTATLRIDPLANGIYLYEIKNKYGTSRKGKVIKK